MTALLRALRSARFDPRTVLAGSVLMFLAAIGGFALAGVTAHKADQVATPVAAICRANTAASIELTSSGACAAADEARTAGPYVITKIGEPGDDGAPGEPGRPGDPGIPGAPGKPGLDGKDGAAGKPGNDGAPGEDGADGEPGSNPPCLDEPDQCRGEDGEDGADGADGQDGQDGAPGKDGAKGDTGDQGPPGPTCPAGTSLQPVTFASGEEGLGCVTEPTPEPAPTTDPGAE